MTARRLAVTVVTVADDGSARPVAGAGRREVVRTSGDETIADALHRRAGRAAMVGAAVGGVALGGLTTVVALALGAAVGVAAGVGAAVALTGGPFFGSLVAFVSALHLRDRVLALLGPDAHARRAAVVLARTDAAAEAAGRTER